MPGPEASTPIACCASARKAEPSSSTCCRSSRISAGSSWITERRRRRSGSATTTARQSSDSNRSTDASLRPVGGIWVFLGMPAPAQTAPLRQPALITHAACLTLQRHRRSTLEPRDPYGAFIRVIDVDARAAQAAVRLVLAQPSIGSQLVDNLNASSHVRALLTDLFLLGEVLKI